MRGRTSFRLSCAVFVAACPLSGALAETEFTPSLAAAVSWVDNIELAPPEQPAEEEWVFQAIPGFSFEYQRTRARATVDYQLTGLFYANVSDRDEAFHNADATLNVDIIERWFFADVDGSYSQRTIEPERAVNAPLLFKTDNIADVATYNVAPYLRHEFRRAVVEARYARGEVKYTDEDPLGEVLLDDSTNEQHLFLLESPEEDDGSLTWRLGYEGQRTSYDVSQDFRYEQASAELGWRLMKSFKLFGRGGLESDLTQDVTVGGLDESWWEAGFDWVSSRGNRLMLAAGERFFGRTVRGLWEREARMLRLHAAYVEQPTTTAHELAFRVPTGEQISPIRPEDLGRLTSEVYLRRAFDASVALTGQRTEVSMFALYERREYLETGLEDRERGGGVSVRRQLSSRFALYGSYVLQKLDLREGGTLEDARITLGLEQRIGTSATASVELARIERDASADPYDVNWATVRFSKEF